jgi:signal transduction histidine kinase
MDRSLRFDACDNAGCLPGNLLTGEIPLPNNHTARRTARNKASHAFARSYLTALAAGVKPAAGHDEADRIGLRAAGLGMGTLALARVHQRAVEARESIPGSTARAESFFARAVSPLEALHSGAPEALAEAGRLASQLHQRTEQLAVVRARLKRLHAERDKSDRHHQALIKNAVLMQQRLRRLSHRLLSAQEDERLRISRDLHDAIGQTLTGINVGLATLKNEAAEDSRDLSAAISRAQQLVERSMKTVHQFAWELRPTLLDDLGLVPALRSYSKTFAERTGVKVRFAADKSSYALSADSRTALFRVAQGALSNVERHAGAGSVSLGLKAVKGAVRLEVKDKGRSFKVASMERSKTNRHLGLLVMRERIEMVGGTFLIESPPGQGTLVRADVPLEAKTNA